MTGQRKARFGYVREDGGSSLRTVWPLGLSYWGAVWTLIAWGELRGGHRNFRLDRMEGLEILEETFTLQPGQTLEDFLARVRVDEG